jgi:hypothetical protein
MLPQHLLDMFTRIPPDTTIENKYFGVYNKLLNGVFDTHDFFVKPLFALPGAFQGPEHVPSADHIVTYVVTLNNKPIFFLEIKPAGHVSSPSTRIAADTQMRHIFCSFYDIVTTPMLHGVSVMGQRLAFYSMEKTTGHIVPERVQPAENYVTDTVLANRWNMDIATEVGHQQFMAVVNDVKGMVAEHLRSGSS